MPYTYDYPRPSVTADIAVFSIVDGALHVLLIERGEKPFKGAWALPGGFLQMQESAEDCAMRELEEETGLGGYYLRQFGVFSDPARDPRGRVITVAFLALIPSDKAHLMAGTDAADAKWHVIDKMPPLAFDHELILGKAYASLRRLVFGTKAGEFDGLFSLLPSKFTLSAAQNVFEVIQGSEIDKRNFRKWILENFSLSDTGQLETGGRHRPAALYQYDR